MKLPLGLYAVSVAAIVAIWWGLGRPVAMPPGLGGASDRVPCLSYAPFRRDQNPLEAGTHIPPAQIDEDLARLASRTACVRTYSIEHGVDAVPEIAKRHGVKVMLGLWLSSHRDKNRQQIDGAIALAKRYPDVVTSVVVGNEVLLRGEMSAIELAGIIKEVKAAAPVPVTYADVWEFWLRNPDLANAVDFVTIHLLPYWEDFPIPIATAAAHADSIRKKVAAAMPGKEIFIGEVGWPSAGRMREGALPSPANQARFLQEVMAIASREHYRVNLIEAFDQPWKRRLEGTVGGHWGIYDAYGREAKFAWGAPVSNHPFWAWQAAAGVALGTAIFLAGWWSARRPGGAGALPWAGVAAIALGSGAAVGWSIAAMLVESLGIVGWARSIAWVAVAIAAPIAGAAALTAGQTAPPLHRVVGRVELWPKDIRVVATGLALAALVVLAIQAAMMLVFDPRYVDFPFAPMIGATVPFAVLAVAARRGACPPAEKVAAAVAGVSAIYIVLNESFANWQAVAFCAALAVFALTLLRSRDEPN